MIISSLGCPDVLRIMFRKVSCESTSLLFWVVMVYSFSLFQALFETV